MLGALNARGTEESGTFQLFVTGAKVAVLLAFIGGALAFRGPATAVGTFAGGFSTDVLGIVTIAALAFITFFGFSAIAASAGEIINPKRTVPLAIAASILAASGIGSLMGRQGQAPRSFSRIHPTYNTPFWSVIAATTAIVAFIVFFIGVFPADGGPVPFDLSVGLPAVGAVTLTELGLTTLTGFATLNLLLPLSIVNVALIYSRRRFPDLDRGFRVPGVPLLPVIGIVANLALITNLPLKGVIIGLVLICLLLGSYLLWGGAPDSEDLFEQVEPPAEPTAKADGAPAEQATAPTTGAGGDGYQILVPVTRPERATRTVQLAATLGNKLADDPFIQVLTTTQITEQTAAELVNETAQGRVHRTRELLDNASIDADYAVEGHVCRDVAFDIVQTARADEADLILMNYLEEQTQIAETVAYKTPCGTLFVSGLVDADMSVVNIGAGAGPHHMDLLPLVERIGSAGTDVHVINVTPEVAGRPENAEETIKRLTGAPSVRLHNVDAQTVASGLVTQAGENGGPLIVGASPSRRLRRRVFGRTPDNVIDLAQSAGVPVLVYASPRGVQSPLEDYVYTAARTLRRKRTG